MSGQADKDIFQGRLVNADSINLPRECFDEVRDELVAIGPLDTHAPVQYVRLDPKSFGNLFRQGLRQCRFNRNDISANLLLQMPWGAERDEAASVNDGQAVASIRLLHQVRRQQNRHAILVTQLLEVIG